MVALCISTHGCTSDNMNLYAEAAIQSISGKWKLVAEEQGIIGQVFWSSVKADSTENISFRADGVLFNSQGLPACCAPSSLTINGSFFEINPKDPLIGNKNCASVSCNNCKNWDILFTGNEIVITSCGNARKKYVRL
jgi:hypothetical protein